METVASPLPENPSPSGTLAPPMDLPGSADVVARPSWWQRATQSGTGVAVELRDGNLDVMVVRVRPSGVKLLGWKHFPSYSERPAAELGVELKRFLKEMGASHAPAHVLLPREETIVRVLHLPGVPDKDLEPAVDLQLESLHPYADQPVRFGVNRIGRSPSVLVGLCREDLVDRWVDFFAETGIKLASFRISADVYRRAVRVLRIPPDQGFLTAVPARNEGVEIYGESPARPIYSALLHAPLSQALTRARSELRLGDQAVAVELESLLQPPEGEEAVTVARKHLALYATALGAASVFPQPAVNLLPTELRKGINWTMLLPTILLSLLLVLLSVGLLVQKNWYEREYATRLRQEITLLERQVAAGRQLDEAGERLLSRIELFKEYHGRTRRDLDALLALTKVLPDTAWVTQLEITPTQVNLTGEADDAGELLRQLDADPRFSGSSFSMPLQRSGEIEQFRVRTNREKQP
jgi:hypothetical protein